MFVISVLTLYLLQKCTPNYFGVTNDKHIVYNYNIQYWGRVYIPSHKSCLGIEVCVTVHFAEFFELTSSFTQGSRPRPQ